VKVQDAVTVYQDCVGQPAPKPVIKQLTIPKLELKFASQWLY
jgi:hypothetical protein